MDRLRLLRHEHTARGIHTAQREYSPYPRELPIVVLTDIDRPGMTFPERAGDPGPLPSQGEGKMPVEGPDVGDIAVTDVNGGIPRTGPDDIAGQVEAPMQEIQERGQHDGIAEPGEIQHGRLQGGR
jgi:hypothetical protein